MLVKFHGKEYIIEFPLNGKLSEFKREVEKRTKVQPEKQKLLFGSVLKGDYKMKEYGLSDTSKLTMIKTSIDERVEKINRDFESLKASYTKGRHLLTIEACTKLLLQLDSLLDAEKSDRRESVIKIQNYLESIE